MSDDRIKGWGHVRSKSLVVISIECGSIANAAALFDALARAQRAGKLPLALPAMPTLPVASTERIGAEP